MVLLVLSVACRAVVLEPMHVASGSMEPTLRTGEHILVLKVGTRDVRRGDVVAFDGTDTLARLSGQEAESTWLGTLLGERRVVYVKRVVAVGGDRIRCCSGDGRLELNGAPLDEPYVAGNPSDTRFDVQVPDGGLWLMGDHRSDSRDSRALLGAPGGGVIRRDKVVGRVILVPGPKG